MWLVAGLGNPGAKYSMNRHNVGFMALDSFCASVGQPKWKDEKQALVTRLKIEDQDALFVKPQNYMNNSGDSVRALLDFYKIPQEKLIVLHDEIDIGFGAIKIQKNRGPGGHNGLKSINEKLGSQDYIRIKLGVGRPPHPAMDVAAFVLQNFSSEEETHLHDFLEAGGDAIETLILEGYDKAATKHTRKPVMAADTSSET